MPACLPAFCHATTIHPAPPKQDQTLTDGAGQRPAYSLRTLCRALDYARRAAPLYGLQRALYDGAAMSFLTQLSPESAPRMEALLQQHLLPGVKNLKVGQGAWGAGKALGCGMQALQQVAVLQGPARVHRQCARYILCYLVPHCVGAGCSPAPQASTDCLQYISGTTEVPSMQNTSPRARLILDLVLCCAAERAAHAARAARRHPCPV
jgi:hypothetical protein